jgi:hypothetical protein
MSKLCEFGLRLPVLLLGLWLSGLAVTSSATAQSIWFAPQPRLGEQSDYMDLFRPDAPWRLAASHVEVFAVGGRFLTEAPEADLRQIFSDLKRRNIGLHIGILPLTGFGPYTCSYGVEGYGGPPMLKFAQRLKALGAEPQVFGMDEPLYFGHVFGSPDGRSGCHTSIAELAREIAIKVAQARTVFPGVRFGDVEPLTFRPGDPWFQNDTWLSDLSDWFDAYQAAVGDKLAFLRLDLWWNMPWQKHMAALTALLARKGIPLQVIYNGNGQDKTDEAWIAHAAAHFKEFESGPWPKPAVAVFQYWTPNPTHVLPESNPLTATGLIDQYVQWRQTRR